ncbi:hypothetical protein LshimejAT787_0902630 [Lyophyllum shimeji]|uniref:DUF6533 domain-containing protein n=1 Tax=Lyophyllum shimeji TaxID=47721 RepID=A0A9P3UPV2_LYOSH|nr:hypothetical protein LshimejAT787_0902630 [Lyophyllum shimeji]
MVQLAELNVSTNKKVGKAMTSTSDAVEFEALYKAGLVPLHACLVGLTWIFHDYFITLEDEIRYIWPMRRGTPKFVFLFGTTALLSSFSTSPRSTCSLAQASHLTSCVAMDPVTRMAGAIGLWSIEIIMQLRVYALYRSSKKIALLNATFFLCSVASFCWLVVYNAQRRSALIAETVRLPLPGCPSLHSGLEWLQWIPATAFEGLLFGFALFKTLRTTASRALHGVKISLLSVVLRDNLLYFFSIGVLLICNNLMVVGVTHIPWFSYSPFHAAMGILTTRMLLNIHKAVAADIDTSLIVRMAQRPHPVSLDFPSPSWQSRLQFWKVAEV